MKTRFDRVILSSNEHENYIEFWPLVSWAWKQFFDVEIDLAFVTYRKEKDSFIEELEKYGNVSIFPEIDGIPSANNAKMARHYLASLYPNDICLINDIDLLILQTDYLVEYMSHYKEGYLLCAGGDVYTDAEQGKFPIGYMVARGSVFGEIINPKKLLYEDFLKSFIGMKIFDHKEDISSKIHNENENTFSDESLYRAMISLWPLKENVIRRPRGFSLYTDRAIDRFDWKYDSKKLHDKMYIEAHLLRPYSKYIKQFEPLVEYIKNDKNIK